jgi:hypothetical protein
MSAKTISFEADFCRVVEERDEFAIHTATMAFHDGVMECHGGLLRQQMWWTGRVAKWTRYSGKGSENVAKVLTAFKQGLDTYRASKSSPLP